MEWKQAVILEIDEKIKHLLTKIATENSKNKFGLKGS